MKRRLLLFLCSPIVAAFQAQLAAAAPASEDVPVRGGIEAVALALGIDPVPDRGRFVSEVTRLVLGIPGRKTIPVEVVAARLKNIPQTVVSTEVVPMPLTAAIWGDAVFHRRVAPEDLLAAILSDRRATLVGHGLASLDDNTLAYLGDHTAILTDLYERHAAAFGAFAASLRIRDDRIAPPGGDAAIPLWEAALGAKVTEPSRFVAALYAHADGRTAYLYDTIGQLDSARAAFALGLWIDDPLARLDGMKALITSWAAAFGDWRLRAQPFARQTNDAATMLTRMRVEATGAPAPPASRTFWLGVFESADLPNDPAVVLNDTAADRPIDAAWMIDATSPGDARRRADRLDQLAFGQRVFATSPRADAPDVLVAARTFPRYRMLMLTLERIGIRAPRLFAAAARHGVRLTSLDGRRAFAATAQFQGVLAMLLRMTAVGTLDLVDAERLVASLIAVPLDDDGRYAGAVARWIRQELGAALPPADTLEASIVAALSGAREGRARPAIAWRGLEYRLDLAGTERRRIERVREKQDGPSIDLALDLSDAARSLSSPSLTTANIRATAARLQSLAKELPERAAADEDDYPSGVAPPPDARNVLARSVDDLNRIATTNDVRRVSRVVRDVRDIADEVMARTLVSLIYAINIGDPDGTALLVGDVSPRHDFGFGARDSDVRAWAPWALPRQDVAPGVPWHVDGSLLGLEVALAPLELRRLNLDRAMAPSMTSNQRDTFAASVVLLNAFALDDDTRDAISAAIENGRRKVAALRENGSGFEAVADAIGMDGARRRAARWTLAHQSDRLESLFSLDELVTLGDTGRPLKLDPWGMAAMASSGCVCTEMSPPGRWRALTGRPQIGLLATTIADLNLHIARTLKVLGLPARLAKYVLGAAVQDFIDEAKPTDPDDWVTLVRAAQSMPRQRIEEFVGAAAVDGPLVLDETTLESQSER